MNWRDEREQPKDGQNVLAIVVSGDEPNLLITCTYHENIGYCVQPYWPILGVVKWVPGDEVIADAFSEGKNNG